MENGFGGRDKRGGRQNMARLDLEVVLVVSKETNSTAAVVRKLDMSGR